MNFYMSTHPKHNEKSLKPVLKYSNVFSRICNTTIMHFIFLCCEDALNEKEPVLCKDFKLHYKCLKYSAAGDVLEFIKNTSTGVSQSVLQINHQ